MTALPQLEVAGSAHWTSQRTKLQFFFKRVFLHRWIESNILLIYLYLYNITYEAV